MSHKHLHLLEAIFTDPVSSNIHWREIESLLHHLGATVETGHGARFRITLNHIEFYIHHPHNSNTCSKSDIKALREHLAHAGISPSSYKSRL